MKNEPRGKLYALEHYDKSIKHPMTNELHIEDARKILGMLKQMTDEVRIDTVATLLHRGFGANAFAGPHCETRRVVHAVV